MRASRQQTTIASPCSLSGRGYWSGEANTLTFLPAPANSGIRFVRSDYPGQPSVEAVAENRVSMPLRTRLSSSTLEQGKTEFDMIEHVMSALYGLGIDNAEVHCTAAEMPGFDGSSHPVALILDSAGKVELDQPRATLKVTETHQIGDDQSFVRVEPSEGETLQLEYRLDYGPNNSIRPATFSAALDPKLYLNEIAPARTFISQADAAELQRRGIAGHVTERDLLVFGEEGPINNQVRFDDECARHKALDVVGDLALAGIDLLGRVTAYRSGHQLNGQMAEYLRETYQKTQPETVRTDWQSHRAA